MYNIILMYAVEIEGLEKTYDPELFSKKIAASWALNGVSLKIEYGTIYTLLGPNGSGKTTLLRILSGIIPPSAGKAKICGIPIENQIEVSKKIGFLWPGRTGLWPFLTGRQNLKYFACLYNLAPEKADFRISEFLKRLNINHAADKPASNYSSGIFQRFLIARAMIHDPEVLLMDEPMVFLDLPTTRELHSLLQEFVIQDMKKTVFLTTHQLEEAQTISDILGFLYQGKLIWEKSAALFRENKENLLSEYLQTMKNSSP